MTATITPLRRPASPARWQSALRRAMEKNIQVRQISGCGAWVATSGTDAMTCYLVTESACECLAAQHGDFVCCHRAMLLFRKNVLSLDPDPTPPAAPAPEMIRCVWCSGSGLDSALFGTGPTTEYRDIPCAACRGAGQVYAEDLNPEPETEACAECEGTGVQELLDATGSFRGVPCETCGESGRVAVDWDWDDDRDEWAA